MMQPHQQGVMNLVKPVEQLEEIEAVQEPVDDATAEALLRCYYLAEFMNGCIVENKYEAPVTLTTSIKLSKSGARIANQVKGDGISLPESQLAAFLVAWAGDELLIDPVETNLESLRLNISSQIKRRKMNFPWIYGRRLYDAIAASPFHGRSRLSYDETIRILNDLPQGVFQLGPYIAGPYGLLEGRDWRYIVPEPYAPCYHCEEVNCDKIHRALFTTGDSGVSKAHTKIIEKVSKSHRIDVTYADAVARVQFSRMPPFSWSNNDGLPFFLFDCFSMEELRLLLAELLDNTAGRLRGDCSSVGMEVKKSIDFVQTLADAELLQLLLLASDADIHSVLNQLVWTGKLAIPLGETKSSRILQGGIGPLGVRIQVSAHGVRHRPPPPLVQLRLRSIMAKCFPTDDKSSQRKLSWILREYEGGSPEARLASALASESPVAIVKKLLVSDEDYYLLALKDLGLPPSFFAAATDDEIANLISWHCGFATSEENSELSSLQKGISELRKLSRTLPATYLDRVDLDRIREIAGNFFVSLEEVLKTALWFTTWALLRDHFKEGYHLRYSAGQANEFFAQWVARHHVRFEADRVDKMALAEILTCFGSLGQFLTTIGEQRTSHARPRGDWPRIARESSSPFDFPFAHIYPFLDLNSESQKTLTSLVSTTPSKLLSAGVVDVRNGLLHHSDEMPMRDAIESAVDAVDARIAELVSAGIYPMVYLLQNSDEDRFGRERILLKSLGGPEVLLTRPTSLDTSAFPNRTSPQVIFARARIGPSGEPLRFSYLKDSSYQEMWKDFPKRPVAQGAIAHSKATQRRAV